MTPPTPKPVMPTEVYEYKAGLDDDQAAHALKCVQSHVALVAALQALADCADDEGKFVQAPTAQMFKEAKAALTEATRP